MKLQLLQHFSKLNPLRGLTKKTGGDRLFTVQEVARFLDMGDKNIYYHIRVGNLEVDRRYGKSLIKESSLNEFIKK